MRGKLSMSAYASAIRCLAVVFLLFAVLSENAAAEDLRTVSPVITMKNYRVEFRKDGDVTVHYKGKRLIYGLGRMFLYGQKPGQSGFCSVYSPVEQIVSIKDKDGVTECSWSGGVEKVGFNYDWKASFLPQSLVFDLKFNFLQEYRSGWVEIPWMVILPDESFRDIAGCRYTAVNWTGATVSGTFPQKPPDGWTPYVEKPRTVQILSGVGVITFRIGAGEKHVNLAGANGKFAFFGDFRRKNPDNTYGYPSGYEDSFQMEIVLQEE